jgi:hypothetical protein
MQYTINGVTHTLNPNDTIPVKVPQIIDGERVDKIVYRKVSELSPGFLMYYMGRYSGNQPTAS